MGLDQDFRMTRELRFRYEMRMERVWQIEHQVAYYQVLARDNNQKAILVTDDDWYLLQDT